MLALNAASKRYLLTLAPNATSNGGDASRVGKDAGAIYSKVHVFLFHYPDAGRVAPISASVWC